MLRRSLAYIKQNRFAGLSAWYNQLFVVQKLNNWVGWLLFLFVGAVTGFLMSRHLLLGLSLTGLVCGVAVLIACLSSAEAGLYINIVYSFFAFHLSRMFFNDTLPVGVFSDILIVATFFSFVINRKVSMKERINQINKSPVSILFIIIWGYTLIELFNPNAFSFNGWYISFRKITGVSLLLFIAYHVLDSYVKVRKYLAVLFAMAALTGLYGCIQQWHGLFSFEWDWVTGDEHRFGLMYINGNIRKFGTMSDPAEYAIVMAACSLLFTILAMGRRKMRTRLILLTGVVFMLLGMSYSGTRTGNAMVVAGVGMYVLLTLQQQNTKVFAAIAGCIFFVLLYGPFHNPTVERFRSTFSASDDASFNVREVNRKFIQPYIYAHPFGGGLGTTGAVGETYNPGHYLAGFQTDSGYLKKAVETGWVGLLLMCTMYFTVLQTGIRGYFRSGNEHYKNIYAGCFAAVFGFYVAEFSQSAIGQITDIVVYYPLVAILMRLKTLPYLTKPESV